VISQRPNLIDPKDTLPKDGVADFKMYHAVLSSDDLPEPVIDPEMEKFMPMLSDYLRSEPFINTRFPWLTRTVGLSS